MNPFRVIAPLFAAAVFGCADRGSDSPKAPAVPIAASHPSGIRLLALDGSPFDLWAGEHRVATVVLFTRRDCPVSNRCAPEVRRLYDLYHPQGVGFYLVYVDPKEKPDAVRQHLREYSYPCDALLDPTHALVAHCGATTTPEAAVFDRTMATAYLGRVNDLYVEPGRSRAEPTSHDLEDALEAIVHGRPVAAARTKAIGCPIADLKD